MNGTKKKNRLNQQKHGLGFDESSEVFKDKNRLTSPDLRKDYGVVPNFAKFGTTDYGEPRWVTIGQIFGEIIAVMRATVARLISARRANRKEREAYHRQ